MRDQYDVRPDGVHNRRPAKECGAREEARPGELRKTKRRPDIDVVENAVGAIQTGAAILDTINGRVAGLDVTKTAAWGRDLSVALTTLEAFAKRLGGAQGVAPREPAGNPRPANRRPVWKSCTAAAVPRDLRRECQEYDVLGNRDVPLRTRGFPKVLIHSLDAVAAKTSPKRSRNDIGAWAIVEGSTTQLPKFWGYDVVRESYDATVEANDTLTLAGFFDNEGWFTVDLGKVHEKPFRLMVTEGEYEGLKAIEYKVGLALRTTMPLAIAAALVGHPDVPEGTRTKLHGLLKNFRDALRDRALEAADHADTARARPKREVAASGPVFEDLL